MIPVRGFEGRTVAVFGLARTGLAAARRSVAVTRAPRCWHSRAAATPERPSPTTRTVSSLILRSRDLPNNWLLLW